MYPFYPLIRDADTIILATPVHWFNMSGQIKQFIDRCYAVAISPDPALPSPFAAKRIGAVLVYGAEDPFDAGAVNALRCFQDICAYTGAQWIGAVYGSAGNPGEIAANTALLEKAEQFGMGL
jgi:multimeric flavodoxin WrbA